MLSRPPVTSVHKAELAIAALVVAVAVGACSGVQARFGEEPAPTVTAATVVRVVDGDTAVFRLEGGATERVRFIGIDTPESTNSVEEYGRAAAAFTARILTPGRVVHLERDVEARDRYGRLLAYVWLERPVNGGETEVRAKMLNARLALEGYAQQMTVQPNSRYAAFFREFVAEARARGAGLWGLDTGG